MGIAYEELEALELDREGQVEWWQANGPDLTADEQEELFEWLISDNKFHYLDLIIELTLGNIENPSTFVEDLERLAPYIDGDLAWSQLYDAFRDRLDGNEQLAGTIYHALIDEDEEWLTWMAGIALGYQAEEVVYDESLDLLSVDVRNKVRAGIQAVIEQYQDEELPVEHVDAFNDLATRSDLTLKQEVLRANAVLFKETDQLWTLTVDIGEEAPETVPTVVNRFADKISAEQLDTFLTVLKHGIESGQSVNISHASYFLHSRFTDQTETLADFVIWLSEHDLYEAGRLAKEIAQENQAFWSVLDDRRDEFPNLAFAERILSETREYVDPDIAELARLLEAALTEPDPQKKGDLLEEAGAHLISLMEEFEYSQNVEATEEEIDIMVHNRFDNHIQRWGTPILIECRNRAKSVQPKYVRDFEGKMWNHNADTGFFIARNGFTDGAEQQVKLCRAPGREKMIGMIPMEELLELTESDEIISLLMDKYDAINEL